MDHSIIIATYNRSAKLRETLFYLHRLQVPQGISWEIVVVDNASTDDTKTMVEAFSAASTLEIKYAHEGTQGLSYARNRGIREARGDIISFIDDDVIVPRTWLVEMQRAFEEYQASCVGGRVLIDANLKLPPWWDNRWHVALSQFDLGSEPIVSSAEHPHVIHMLATGGNVGYRRSVLERCGGLRTDLGRVGNRPGGGEDIEIMLRLQRSGETVVYHPAMLLYHSPPVERYTKAFLMRFFYRYGETTCQQDMISPEKSKRIAGVPGWRCKRLLAGAINACWRGITGGRREALFQGMHLIWICGYAIAVVKTRRDSIISVRPPSVRQQA